MELGLGRKEKGDMRKREKSRRWAFVPRKCPKKEGGGGGGGQTILSKGGKEGEEKWGRRAG